MTFERRARGWHIAPGLDAHPPHDHHQHLSHVPAARVALAAGITVLAGAIELLASRASGSLFLLADAVHLLAHLGIFLVLLIPPGRLHGASEDLGAVSVLLIVVAIAGWVVWISVQHLIAPPEEVPNPAAMLVSLLGLAANTCSALLFRNPAATHFSFRAALAHELSDGGMTLAGLVGAGCISLFGWRWVDPALSLVIGIWLGVWSIRLLVRRVRRGPEVFFEH
ncbi:MAG TPA: cation transporter [Myxococcaceae bacterium]|nr:cation transporter [Myxococcaceae bacterium]